MNEEGVPVFITILIAAGIIGAFIFAALMVMVILLQAA